MFSSANEPVWSSPIFRVSCSVSPSVWSSATFRTAGQGVSRDGNSGGPPGGNPQQGSQYVGEGGLDLRGNVTMTARPALLPDGDETPPLQSGGPISAEVHCRARRRRENANIRRRSSHGRPPAEIQRRLLARRRCSLRTRGHSGLRRTRQGGNPVGPFSLLIELEEL
jgi:hypothetical protein